VLLVEVADLRPDAQVLATASIDGEALPGWRDRPVDGHPGARRRLVLHPEVDLGEVDLGFATGFLRQVDVEVRVVAGDAVLGVDRAALDVADVQHLGGLYRRIIDRLVAPDTARQAAAAGLPDPGVAYHPWFPVLRIGGEKAALYTQALVADIVGKAHHLTDPRWLLRVGVHLELLTCLGIIEAVRPEVGDLLTPEERAAFQDSPAYEEVRRRIDPEAWREVWRLRRIAFPAFGSPRTGPVSARNLLRKRAATLQFLHTHHEDLKHAIELAGPNLSNAQETWQRVFRDAERAVLHKAAEAFPELAFLPPSAREVVLWQRFGTAGQQGVYPTACAQYRASMNAVADWARDRRLMDHAGEACIPPSVSLLEAIGKDPAHVAVLQRRDGLAPRLDISEPAARAEPTTEEVEALLAEVPIFRMLSAAQVHQLALAARPLLLGPTERFVVQGAQGTSLFLVGEGTVEVRQRDAAGHGSDRLVATLGRGEVVGEMALLTGEPRTATVRSVGEAVVYEVGREQYEPLLQAHPEWLEELAAIMHRRLAAGGDAGDGERERQRPLLERIRRSLQR
jgi:hypothetical protein